VLRGRTTRSLRARAAERPPLRQVARPAMLGARSFYSFGERSGFACGKRAEKQSPGPAADRDVVPRYGASLAPEVIDHRMVHCRAAIGPGDVRPRQDFEIFALQQDTGREAGVAFVECRLERETPGWAQERRQHRQWPAVEPDCQSFEPAASGGALECLAAQRGGALIAGECRTLPPLPTCPLEGEERFDPRGEIGLVVGAFHRQLTLFGEATVLTAKLLAFLPGKRFL